MDCPFTQNSAHPLARMGESDILVNNVGTACIGGVVDQVVDADERLVAKAHGSFRYLPRPARSTHH